MATELTKVQLNLATEDSSGTLTAKEEVNPLTSAESVVFSDTEKTLPDELDYRLTYTNTAKTTTAVGGIDEGTSFSTGTNVKDLITKLLYPTTGPVITLTSSVSSLYQTYGTNISPITFTCAVVKKSYNIASIDLYANGTKVGSFSGISSTGGTFTFTYSGTVNYTTTFFARVTVADSSSTTYDSNHIKITFNFPIYVGSVSSSATINKTLLETLTKHIDYDSSAVSITQNMNPDNQCFLIAYKAYTDNAEIFKVYDPNGFDITRSFTKSSVTILDNLNNSQTYTVYISNATTQTDFAITCTISQL